MSESLSRLDPLDDDERGELMVGRGNRSAGCWCSRSRCSSVVEALLSMRTRQPFGALPGYSGGEVR